MKILDTPKLLCSVLATALALTAGSARANDDKILPGELCNPDGDDSGVGHYRGRVRNMTNASMSFECPVVRDTVAQELESGMVWVVDDHASQAVSCTLRMIPSDTGTLISIPNGYFFSTKSTPAGHDSATVTALPAFALLGHLDDAYLQMSCSVPGLSGGGASGIVAYFMSEDT